jgi:hypothetical protein
MTTIKAGSPEAMNIKNVKVGGVVQTAVLAVNQKEGWVEIIHPLRIKDRQTGMYRTSRIKGDVTITYEDE